MTAPVHSRQGVGEAVERFAWAAGVYEDEQMLSDINTIRAALSSQAEALEAMAGALEPFALLAADDETRGVNMNDPISKWLTIANLQRASEALSTYLQTKEDTA